MSPYFVRAPRLHSPAAFPNGAAREMNMLYRFLAAGAAICALLSLGFSGQADASKRLTLKAPSLTILAADEENPEVDNLLDPDLLCERHRLNCGGAYAASALSSSR